MMGEAEKNIAAAARALEAGKLVAFPTETVYGIGGDATSDAAVAAIYAAKGRPPFNPLIVHMCSLTEAKKYVDVTPLAENLAAEFWPGPLTLVMNRKKSCTLSLLVSAGLNSVAVRVPAHPIARRLLEECKLPIAAPSANRSGRVSPTTAAHVKGELAGEVAMILDGGACEVGLESTVVDATGEVPVILRPGSITREMLEAVAGRVEMAGVGDPIKSPGMLERHYAPNATLRLHAKDVQKNEALLAFGKPLAGHAIMENLSPSANLEEAAANLFAMLRRLDATGAKQIAIMEIPEKGIGLAINDRLQRAAKLT